jgi:protein O-GlcNAc transferase
MSLKKAREIIADQSLDVLVYPDIGMEPLTYYLAFTRLAPVQCVMVGHLVTTGIPNMDYYLSSELIEPGNGREHYSEKLVLLKSMPGYVVKPEMPHPSKSRSALGLPEDRNLYICPMSLQKIHPDFDQAVAGILKEDPQGEIIFFKNVHNNNWHPLIINRFRKTFPDLMDRVRFLPWANPEDFKSILMAADVALDTFHFGGGVTSYIILAAGTPIVTWPGPFMRGRMTLGCYRKIEMMDCVAHSQAEYVEIAVKLGTDRNFRDSVKNKIAKNNGLLFEDAEVISELRDFFKKAARRTIS